MRAWNSSAALERTTFNDLVPRLRFEQPEWVVLTETHVYELLPGLRIEDARRALGAGYERIAQTGCVDRKSFYAYELWRRK
jgi:hypothetical protein